MFYVYILKSQKDNKLYIGFTNDLKNRLIRHNGRKVRSTKGRLPLKLIYYEAYQSMEDAKNREKQIKYFGKVYSQLKRRIEKSLKA
ncbi:MAG: GIY-YIG nuclease family protein [Patescibacteria group bacterium]|jgi:putative endonuclease